ncbi:MAG: hypothetical protein IKD54_01980 [Clostridia bacterium]|nr:hypothetical protein [Clostridia bacterium]
MDRFYKGYDDIAASDVFKQRMVRMMQGKKQTARAGLHLNRRTAILIAAATLLLAIGTAVAVGLTTVGRIKGDTEQRLETSEDERYLEARRAAEAYVNSTMFETPVEGTATVGDLKLTLVWVLNDPHDLQLCFDLTSDTTGVLLAFDPELDTDDYAMQRTLSQYETFCAVGTDACDFRLTYKGADYAPYRPSGESFAAGNYLEHFSMLFKTLPDVLQNGDELTLSGKLYRYDKDGNRLGEIGSFSIPFRFEETEEMREKRIEEQTQIALENIRESDAYRHDLVSDLPDEATPIDVTLGDVTIADVAADEEGLLLGVRYHTQTDTIWNAQMLGFFMNGYYVESSMLGMTDDPIGDGTSMMTLLLRLPYYAAKEYLPDTLTIACERWRKEAETHQMFDDNGNIVDQTQPAYEPVDFVFRYDRKTGKVTLPKDDQERVQWFEKPKLFGENPMMSFGMSGKAITVKGVSMEQNGTTVTIERVLFREDGRLAICYQADHLACEVLTMETFPAEITVNGVPVSRYTEKDLWGTSFDYRMSDSAIRDFLDNYSMEKVRWVRDIWEVVPPMRFDMYDGPITIEIRDWELYDLSSEGERVKVGTFSFTFSVDPKDAIHSNGRR